MNHYTSKTHQLFQYSVIALAFTIPLSIAAYTALSALLLILWIIEGNWRSKWDMIKNQPFFKAMFLFYLFMVLSLIWTDNYVQGLEHLRKWYYLILLLPILYTSIDRQRIPQIFSAFLTAMIISEILSYLIFFDLMPFKLKESWSSIDPSPFMHHTPYSIFLIFTIFLMATRLLTTKRTKVQLLFYSFFILTMTANLFLNAGRTGQFALLITLIVFLSLHFKLHWLKTFLLTTLISSSVFITAFFTSPNFHTRSVETYQTFHYLLTEGKPLNDSTGMRFMMWQVGYEIISHNPLLGVGVGDDRDVYIKTLEISLPEIKDYVSSFSDFHNTYFQITVSAGIIGLSLFLYMFVVLYKNLDDEKNAHLLATIMLILLLLYMMIGNFPASYLTTLFVLIISFSLKLNHKSFIDSTVQ